MGLIEILHLDRILEEVMTLEMDNIKDLVLGEMEIIKPNMLL